MPRTVPIQTSFAGGELSPKLRGRVETDLWKKGLAYCENWEPLAHGPLLSRGGTRFVSLLEGLTPRARLVSFPRQGDVGFLLALGGGKLRVLDGASGTPAAAGTIDRILNPRFTYGWNYWTKQNAGVVFGRYVLTRKDPVSGENSFAKQATAPLPAGTYTLRVVAAIAAGQGLRVRVGSTLDGIDLLSEILPSTGAIANAVTTERTITLGAPGQVYVWVETTNSNFENFGSPPAQIAAELVEVALREPGVGNVEWTAVTTPAMPWADDQLEDIQMVSEPARDRVMFFHPKVAPYELLYDSETGAWTFNAITFTFADPLDPPWKTPNFPGVAELYQGRLIVGGIPGKANTILGSKSGNPYNFEATEMVRGVYAETAACAFSLEVSTKGAIKWLQGHRTLLIGTDRGEFVLTAQGGVLTPSDFEVRPQSGFGASSVQAVQLGDQAMYVSRDRRRIRALSFNLQENGWQSRDLTFTSEHLTGGEIREVHWLSTGNDQVLAVMRSGELVCWSFNRPESVIAPWRATFGGAVHSLAVLDFGGQDKVWMLVARAGGVALEEWVVEDDPERVLLDSWVDATTLTNLMVEPHVQTIIGLEHLEGESVIAIRDGVIQPAQTVSGGAIPTYVGPTESHCYVGLYAPRTFTTLPKEGGQPGGTAQGSKQRLVKASLRLNDSAIPLVDGKRAAPDRTPSTPMNTTEGRITDDVVARLLGWEAKGTITVSQDVPIRTEILALYGVLATSEV